jgi:hypothetical protein
MLDEARQAFQEHNASNQSVNQDTLTCASVYGTAQGRREGHPPTRTTGLMLSCRPCLLHPHLFTHSSAAQGVQLPARLRPQAVQSRALHGTALASHVQPGQALGSSEVTRVSYAVVDYSKGPATATSKRPRSQARRSARSLRSQAGHALRRRAQGQGAGASAAAGAGGEARVRVRARAAGKGSGVRPCRPVRVPRCRRTGWALCPVPAPLTNLKFRSTAGAAHVSSVRASASASSAASRTAAGAPRTPVAGPTR